MKGDPMPTAALFSLSLPVDHYVKQLARTPDLQDEEGKQK